MVSAIGVLTSISVLLLVGILVSTIGSKFNIPDVLLLILAGILFGVIKYKGEQLISFPPLFLTSISLLALAMIVFDAAARIKIREFDTFSLRALKLVLVFLFLNLTLFSTATFFMFKTSVLMAVLFAAINSGTSPEVVLSVLRGAKYKIVELLKMESIINTPLTVLLPFIVIDVAQNVGSGDVFTQFIDQLVPFLTTFVSGIGAGILVGIILFKVMKRSYSTLYSPLAVIVAALLSYVLAENLGGNGVLAVTTLGIFFGNIYVKERVSLLTFESLLSKALYILVFVLVGLVIKIPLTKVFLIKSISLFLIYLLIRFISVYLSFAHYGFTMKELVFASLNASKGLATVAVVFIFAIYNVPGSNFYLPGISAILDLTLAFVFYSILVSAVVLTFSHKFVGPDAPNTEEALRKKAKEKIEREKNRKRKIARERQKKARAKTKRENMKHKT